MGWSYGSGTIARPAWPIKARGEHRPRGYELFSQRVDPQVQPFERPCTEQDHVARLGEDDEVGSGRSASVHDREPYLALERAAIGDDESLHPFGTDPERLEGSARSPRVLAASINECVLNSARVTAALGTLEEDRRTKRSHVGHCSRFREVVAAILSRPSSKRIPRSAVRGAADMRTV